MKLLSLIGRNIELFSNDVESFKKELQVQINNSSFLVLGGAGSIGQAVVKELFQRSPKKLHVVDISENNLVELVRDLRSTFGYISGDFRTFALDVGSVQYDAFIKADGKYDYILNLSALKHVRSEKDPFTLMRMIDVNIFNTIKTLNHAKSSGAAKYFAVSTDKAANPVNMMGASKRIMELFLMQQSNDIAVSTARFANVAFSDGSLLHGFRQRLLKKQPIVAPNDVKRYFVTEKEAGQLCLMSCLFGANRDIYFPKLDEHLHLIPFSDIAERFLISHGFEPYQCQSEDEARAKVMELEQAGKWPCLFTKSDTTGEKDFEEFYMKNEEIDMNQYEGIGIVKSKLDYDEVVLQEFTERINTLKAQDAWTKTEIVQLFQRVLPDFEHAEKGKYLDEKM